MFEPSTRARGDRLRALLKKSFVLYLAAVTGCANTVHDAVEQSQAVEQPHGASYQVAAQSGSGVSASTGAAAAAAAAGAPNRYNLPELGMTAKAPAPEPKSQAKDPLADLLGGNTTEQRTGSNPNAKGYEGSSEFQNLALGMLASATAQSVKDWFSAKHATAELQMSAGRGGVKIGSFDLLMPIYDTEKDLFFTQLGVRRSNAHTEDYRNTVNLGVGYRKTLDTWLVGANTFYDRDLTGKNDRLGIGAEAMTDYLKLSANGYLRLSDWKQSPDLENYLERPASGFDLRAEAYLPAYPQLGGKLVYEQYYGNEVALFGASDRQKDPSAVTVGVMYNPVPMVGLGLDHRQGQGGLSDNTLKLSINYQFDVPLQKQLSSDYVTSHKLGNARYDLVSRNNEIVLDYKKAEHAQLSLPAQVSGTPTAIVSFPVTVSGGRIGNVTWTGSAASFAQPFNGSGSATLQLPAYNSNGANLYTLQAVGTDVYGEAVRSNVMTVTVNAFMIALARSKAEATADGSDAVMFTATLQEPSGAPRANTAITWTVNGDATVQSEDRMTNRVGQANLKLVSRFASAVRVQAKEPQGAMAASDADFLGDPATAKIVSLKATPASILANGSATSELVADVVDAQGNPLGAGVNVQWSSTAGSLASSATSTDANSQAHVVLTAPTLVGTSTITARAAAGSATTAVNFVADNATAKVLSLVANPTAIAANGTATSTLVATIVDAHGNSVGAGIPVQWATSSGTLSASSSVTDASSKASITLKSATTAGTASVTATAAAGNASADVKFNADTTTAKVIGLVATPATIAANGTTTSSLVATVQDANGNTVGAGVPVTWTTTAGTLSTTSSSTDANGKATATLKGTIAGTATVTAAATAGSSNATVTLVPDTTTAKVIGLVATPATITANGTSNSSLVATVTDANGNLVGAGVPVNWSTTSGTLSTASSTTDASGKALTTLKGTAAGTATVTAAAAAGSATAAVVLVADNSTAKVISLVATPATIAANGTTASSLVATVQDANGNVVGAGVNVTWSTTSGILSTASSTTDANGKATATLKGTVAGTASVTATAVAGASTAQVNLVADTSTAKVVGLTATPATITANGTSTSTLVATVTDANGNAVGAGVSVSWSTTSGTLSTTSSTTDANGKAMATLKGTTAGTATITAAAAAGSSSTNVTLIADTSTAKVIGVVATPATIPANGTSTSSLVATVTDANGNALGAGIAVTWSTTSGTLSTASSTTDTSGKATATLKGTTAGTATVTAAATAGSSSTSVNLVADNSTAHVVSLVATPATITANGSATSTLVAMVKDANGNTMGAGVAVSWSTTSGTLSTTSSTTDATGKATATLRGTVAATAMVTASATAGSSSTNVTLVADASTAKVIGVVATPSSITANGSSSSTLVATVTDANGNALGSGITVTWSTTSGTLSTASSTTDASGKATATLKGTAAGTATVTASATAGSASTAVTLVADNSTARVVGLVATPSTVVANGTAGSALVATVKDANNNPVGAGVTVTWSTTGGTLSTASSTTNASGQAAANVYNTVSGAVTVTAAAVAGSSTAAVTFVPDTSTARATSLVASPTSITANGTAASTLTATIKDASGNTVGAGVGVNWSTTRGSLSTGYSTTNASGQATAVLRGTSAGAATVTAAPVAGSASVTVYLVEDASTRQVASLVATPTSINANGTDTSTLVATIQDANGNAMGAGYVVSWSTNLGTLSASSSSTDSAGHAAVTLKGAAAGTATVTATILSSSRSANVTLVAVNPVITAYSVAYNTSNNIVLDGGQVVSGATFSWAASNAASYQIIESTVDGNRTVYSGTGTSYTYPNGGTTIGGSWDVGTFTLQVTGPNGATTSQAITPNVLQTYNYSGSSG